MSTPAPHPGIDPILVVVPTGEVGGRDALGPVLDLWSRHLCVLVADAAAPPLDLLAGEAGGAAHLLGLGSGVGVALAAQQRRPGAVRSLVLADTCEPPPGALSRRGGVLVVNGQLAPPEYPRHGDALVRMLGGHGVVLPGEGPGVYLAGRRFLDLVLSAVAMADPILLAEPDPAWRDRFAALRDELLAVTDDRVLGIEHIGSTAVPGLVAKPVIDLLLGVRATADADALIPALRKLGWSFAEGLGVIGERRYLFRLAHGRRIAHLHIVPYGGKDWVERRAFRDRLRTSPADAAAYTRSKLDLALRHPDDREAYTCGKTAFVANVLHRIRSGSS